MQQDSLSANNTSIGKPTYYMLKTAIDTDMNKSSDSLNKYSDSLSYTCFFSYASKYNNQPQSANLINTRPSMFAPHLLKVKHLQQQTLNTYSTDWILITLLLCTSLFAWIYYSSSKRIKQIFNAILSNRSINQLNRDGDLFKERISIPLTINYLVTFSLFVFFIIHHFANLKANNLYTVFTFLKIFALVSLLVLAKWTITSFIGFVFKNNNASSIILLNSLIFNIVIGILLIPINVFLNYTNYSISVNILYFGVFTILIINTIRYYRNIIIGISYSKFSQFYLFLYLCTLEILPLLIIIKLSIGLIDKLIYK